MKKDDTSLRQVIKYTKSPERTLYISSWKLLGNVMSVLEALPESGNKTEWRHDTELMPTSIARSDLKLKSSIRQPKNNSFKYKWKGRWCHHGITAALCQTGLIRRAELNDPQTDTPAWRPEWKTTGLSDSAEGQLFHNQILKHIFPSCLECNYYFILYETSVI